MRLTFPSTSPTNRSSWASAMRKVSGALTADDRGFQVDIVPTPQTGLAGGSAVTRRCAPRRASGFRGPGNTPCTPALLVQEFEHGLAQHRRRAYGLDPGPFERPVLLCRRARAAGDDSAGVTHELSGRCGDAGDVRDHGLADFARDVGRGGFFIAAADFAHHDYALGGVIGFELTQHVDEVHATHRV